MDINDKDIEAFDETVPTDDPPKTSLEFEIAEAPGLVFTSEVEVDADYSDRGGLVFEAKSEPEVKPEEAVPDVFATVPETPSTSYASDSTVLRVTYIPRFTGASERYRVRPTLPTEQKAETAEVKLDPTAEIGEDVVDGCSSLDTVYLATNLEKYADLFSDTASVYYY